METVQFSDFPTRLPDLVDNGQLFNMYESADGRILAVNLTTGQSQLQVNGQYHLVNVEGLVVPTPGGVDQPPPPTPGGPLGSSDPTYGGFPPSGTDPTYGGFPGGGTDPGYGGFPPVLGNQPPAVDPNPPASTNPVPVPDPNPPTAINPLPSAEPTPTTISDPGYGGFPPTGTDPSYGGFPPGGSLTYGGFPSGGGSDIDPAIRTAIGAQSGATSTYSGFPAASSANLDPAIRTAIGASVPVTPPDNHVVPAPAAHPATPMTMAPTSPQEVQQYAASAAVPVPDTSQLHAPSVATANMKSNDMMTAPAPAAPDAVDRFMASHVTLPATDSLTAPPSGLGGLSPSSNIHAPGRQME